MDWDEATLKQLLQSRLGWRVYEGRVANLGNQVSFRVELHGRPLKYADMDTLSEILGTKHIDFENDRECTFGGSDVTPSSWDELLVVTAWKER